MDESNEVLHLRFRTQTRVQEEEGEEGAIPPTQLQVRVEEFHLRVLAEEELPRTQVQLRLFSPVRSI